MFTDMPFEEWLKHVKQKFAASGLQLPEEEELLELAYMECRADNKSIEQFVEDTAKEQNNGQ
jgi:hypothetical protein